MKIGVLTSVETRHRYLVQRLRDVFSVAIVAYERTGYQPSDVRAEALDPPSAAIVTGHFRERARQEERVFGAQSGWVTPNDDCRVLRLEPGTLNRPTTVGALDTAGVEVVVVYGTNLIREPLLSAYAGRMINLHLGLSPYYRGTATNFYPLLNEEPEYVGATIHLITKGIDSGPILRHARPIIGVEDRPHTIGCKAIEAGVDALIDVLCERVAGGPVPVPQWPVPNAHLYLRKDYHPRQIVELYRKLDQGLIPRYVRRAAAVAPRVRLVVGPGEVSPTSVESTVAAVD